MGLSDEPLVTIGLPVRNGADFIADAIRSVVAQTEPRWRLVISDNASDDRTMDIVEQVVNGDSRVTVISQPRDLGVAANFRAVLAKADTPYVKWLAADDMCGPRFLELCLERLEAEPELIAAYPSVRLIDHGGEVREISGELDFDYTAPGARERVRRVLFDDAAIYSIFSVMRTAALGATHGYQGFYGADKVLMVELLSSGRIALLPERETYIRCHRGQTIHLPMAQARATTAGRPVRASGAAVIDRAKTVRSYLACAWHGSERVGRILDVGHFLVSRSAMRRRESVRNELRAIAATSCDAYRPE